MPLANEERTSQLIEQFKNIPEELRRCPQWICWKSVPNPQRGKADKLPINPLTGRLASTRVRGTWTDFETAVGYFDEESGPLPHTHVDKDGVEHEGQISGVGFVFSNDDPFAGVDVDECTTTDGELAPWAEEVMAQLDSYIERSPSGRGYHIIVKGSVPRGFHRSTAPHIGVFSCHRYFTFTGAAVKAGAAIEDRRELVAALYEKYGRREKKKKNKYVDRHRHGGRCFKAGAEEQKRCAYQTDAIRRPVRLCERV